MQRLPRSVPNDETHPAHPTGMPIVPQRTRVTRSRAVAIPRPLAPPINRSLAWLALLMVFALLLAGCGAAEVAPSAAITEPTQNATFKVGDSITIKGKAGGTALKAVDLYVNSTLLARSNQPVAENEFEMQVNWTPDINGPVILVIKGVNDKDEAIISSDPVFITIEGDAAAPAVAEPTVDAAATPDPAAALPTAAPQPTLDPNQPLATSDPAIVATVATTATTSDPAATAPAATTAPVASSGGTTVSPIADFSNVRKGPGLTYDIVGTLAAGQSATVKGRNADSTWYQINFAAGDNGTGWIFGEVVTVTGSTSGLPVGEAPPLPTAAPTSNAPAPTAPPADVPVVPIVPVAPAEPTAGVPPAAALPYDQGPGLLFEPRNGLDYDALRSGEQTEAVWSIKGATSAQMDIVGATPPDIYDCPAGNTADISVQGRQSLTLPDGRLGFNIKVKGYYVVTIYVAKADGSNTTIPRGIVVDCYKKPGR